MLLLTLLSASYISAQSDPLLKPSECRTSDICCLNDQNTSEADFEVSGKTLWPIISDHAISVPGHYNVVDFSLCAYDTD